MKGERVLVILDRADADRLMADAIDVPIAHLVTL